MRKLLLMAVVLTLTACGGPRYAQVPVEQQGHKGVIKVAGIDKQTLFNRASEWVALKYVSGKDVIQEKNPQTGRIIGRGAITVEVDSGGLINTYQKYTYSLIVDVKDGKARIQLGDYTDALYGNSPSMALHINPLNAGMKELAADFESYLKTGGSGSVAGGSDDW